MAASIPISEPPAAGLTVELQAALGDAYVIERELGRGGMGTVLLARDTALDRPVAIKVLPPELAVRPELRERFLHETRTAAGFSHPNIVPVHAVIARGDLLCFVMGYVDGETLTQRIRRAGPLNAGEAVRLLQEVAWALSYAHGRGVVHRDIKPDNILIERATGRYLVSDFGIAKSNAASGLTAVGDVVGTPHYMSPEQAAGDTLDGRSDLYSLGVVAFCAVTGHVPFEADSAAAIMAMHLTRPPAAVATERPDLPAALSKAIDRCLAKAPEDRFPTGEALAEAVDAVRASRPEVAAPIRLFHYRAASYIRSALLLALLSDVLISKVPGRADADRFVLGAILASAVVGLLLQIPLAMRGLARLGFGFDDLRAGLQAIGRERTEAEAQARAMPGYRARRRRTVGGLIAAMVVGALIVVWGLSFRTPLGGGMYRIGSTGLRITAAGMVMIIVSFVMLVASSGVSGRMDSRINRLWTGWFGARLYALASWRLGTGSGAARRGDTVTPGGRGALTVLEGLPKPLRRQFGRIAGELDRLEQARAALAAREAELDAAIAEAAQGESAAGSRRAAVLQELQDARRDAVARREALAGALEDVRLQLLRVRGGIGSVAEVEAELAQARGMLDQRPAASAR